MVWFPGKPNDGPYLGVCFKGDSQPAGNTTTTTTSAPWDAQQPYLLQGFQAAKNLYDQGGPQYFPGQTYAGPTTQQTQAVDLATNRALSGSPVTDAAKSNITGTLNGDYLNSNPYLDAAYGQASDQLVSQMRSAFGGSDVNPNTNSALLAATSTGLANLGNQIYGTNYQNERQRQMQAGLEAPTLANQDYVDIAQLGGAGNTAQGFNQAAINDAINRYNYNQNLPYNNLANYFGFINGNYGSSNTQTTPYFNSGASGGIGGALGGAASGAMIGSSFGPWGTAIGGIGGLLGGLF